MKSQGLHSKQIGQHQLKKREVRKVKAASTDGPATRFNAAAATGTATHTKIYTAILGGAATSHDARASDRLSSWKGQQAQATSPRILNS
ncbi:hypothetical protein RRG08_008931 [Elysia crispata]|uniref:Uncharacterized protein n=1 Tax=Elysia crispata TaxID=231223 RepID=A0AAE0ZX47_9GAST|nr:hypothetical protein RRG08_008931 [Elysia crispata]